MKNLLIIIIFIFSTQLVQSQECNLNPERGSKNYIIGYGSLMDKESRIRTNKSAFVVKPILVKGFDRESLMLLKNRKNLRIIDITKFKLKNANSLKTFDGSFLIQNKDKVIFDKKKLKFVTKLKPNRKELEEIKFAYNICKYVKSNAILFCKNEMTIGIGAGQMSRVYSSKIAAIKAQDENLDISGSVMSSDAFFPFRDGIDAVAEYGISAVIQPGGSIRDDEVIAAANEHNMAMVFTAMRHFRH